MPPEELQTVQDVWLSLSNDARKLAVMLSLPGGSKSRWYLEQMSEEMEVGLEVGLDELDTCGMLVLSSSIQEKRMRLEELGGEMPIDEITMTRQDDVTDVLRERLRLQSDVRAYEEDPESHRRWEQPRYGLRSELRDYIEALHAAAEMSDKGDSD
jgi:hypothetical protein